MTDRRRFHPSGRHRLPYMHWLLLLALVLLREKRRESASVEPGVAREAQPSQLMGDVRRQAPVAAASGRASRFNTVLTIASVIVAGASAYAAISALTSQQEQEKRHQAEQVLLVGVDPPSPSGPVLPDPDLLPRIQNFSRLPLSGLSLDVDADYYGEVVEDAMPAHSVSVTYGVGALEPCTEAVLEPITQKILSTAIEPWPAGLDPGALSVQTFTLRYIDTAGRAWSRRNQESPIENPSYLSGDEGDSRPYIGSRVVRQPIPNCVPQ